MYFIFPSLQLVLVRSNYELEEVRMINGQDSDVARCIKNCLATAKICQEAQHFILKEQGTAHSGAHVEILQTCMDVCMLSARLMMIESPLHSQACELCFEACGACATECERYEGNYEVLVRCAEACRRSEESCRGMAGMTVHTSKGSEKSTEMRT